MTFEVEYLPRQREKLYRNVTCDGCNSSLKEVLHNEELPEGVWHNLQANDALEINLTGGYGQFIDPFNTSEDQNDIYSRRIIDCSSCKKTVSCFWHWEISNFEWVLEVRNEEKEECTIFDKCYSEQQAKKLEYEFILNHPNLPRENFWIARVAVISKINS